MKFKVGDRIRQKTAKEYVTGRVKKEVCSSFLFKKGMGDSCFTIISVRDSHAVGGACEYNCGNVCQVIQSVRDGESIRVLSRFSCRFVLKSEYKWEDL